MTAACLSAGPDGNHRPTVIDEHHLRRMTLGDHRLEREVLELFLRQTTLMLNRIVGAEPPLAAAAAHTLKGSARGIGAWRVARAAELVEQAAGGDGEDDGTVDTARGLDEAVAALEAATLEASAAIATRLTTLLAELGRER